MCDLEVASVAQAIHFPGSAADFLIPIVKKQAGEHITVKGSAPIWHYKLKSEEKCAVK